MVGGLFAFGWGVAGGGVSGSGGTGRIGGVVDRAEKVMERS